MSAHLRLSLSNRLKLLLGVIFLAGLFGLSQPTITRAICVLCNPNACDDECNDGYRCVRDTAADCYVCQRDTACGEAPTPTPRQVTPTPPPNSPPSSGGGGGGGSTTTCSDAGGACVNTVNCTFPATNLGQYNCGSGTTCCEGGGGDQGACDDGTTLDDWKCIDAYAPGAWTHAPVQAVYDSATNKVKLVWSDNSCGGYVENDKGETQYKAGCWRTMEVYRDGAPIPTLGQATSAGSPAG